VKKIIFCMLLGLLLIPAVAFGSPNDKAPEAPLGTIASGLCSTPPVYPDYSTTSLRQIMDELARGCCSWHKGVCDCDSYGRVICCDGTKSPSCRC
jgi:hypothetical protein